MTLVLQQTETCTAFTAPSQRCGNVGQCTKVRTLDAKGNVLHEHWVCRACRKRMDLPEFSIEITPQGWYQIV